MSPKNQIKWIAAIALVLSVLGWGSAPVFIRWLGDAYDPYSQAFIRYASAAFVLTLISLRWYRYEFLKAFFHPDGIIGIALVTVVLQTFWTLGCLKTSSATVAQLLSKLSIFFVIPFGYFLFKEERKLITSPFYLIGTLLSFLGLIGVLQKDAQGIGIPSFDAGTIYLLLTAVLWAIYTVWARHIVLGIHPIPMFTVMAIQATAGLGISCFLLGNPITLMQAGFKTAVLAFISGMFPIALAHPCFHYAQRYLGSAFCSTVNLTNPLATYIFAWIILPQEKLTLYQWIGGIILLLGTFLVVHKAHDSAEQIAITTEHNSRSQME